MTRFGRRILIWRMRWHAALDRHRLRVLCRKHPGLEVHPDSASVLSHATLHLEPGARVRIAAGVVTERRPDGLRIEVRAGGELVIGEGTWLRTELLPIILSVYEGAHLIIGPRSWLNGCQLSAKVGLDLDRAAWVGPGSRVFDSDQHALDDETPEQPAPVRLGAHTWIASDVTVLRGVEIGAHSVIGARSLVTRSVPPHSLAYGIPARVHGRIGDRTQVID